jgi:LPS-assembly protein
VALLFFPVPAAISQSTFEKFTTKPEKATGYRLWADHFLYNERQDSYSASGNVILRAENRVIRADRMRLDGATREAILEGHVRIEQNGDWLEGEQAYLDLEEETGVIQFGKGFLADGNFHFSGDLIEKLGPQTYHVRDGRFTTCDGDRPSWHFRTSDLKVTIEGYGLAKHTRFHIGRVPVLYSPYLVFPAKTERQSGLLMPRFGVSELLGYDVDLPLFWAISTSTDATIYAHYMSKRGLMMGPEFRYATSRNSEGVLRFDYLRDQEDKSELREQNFFDDPGLQGVNKDRWWWRSKQNFVLPYRIQGNADLDLVSDPDYLQTFETGFSSWRESHDIFLSTLGRGLINDDTVTTRESVLLLNRYWASHSVNFALHYYQNLNDDRDETTLQQLPFITYNAARQPLFSGPLFIDVDVDYVNYWRPEGTRGNRLNANPRLSLPFRSSGHLEVEPFVGFLGTFYLIDHFEEAEGSRVKEKTLQSREIFEAGIDTSTDVVRIFTMGEETWTKTKHTLRPRILYEYRPEVSQRKFPNFDATDRINSRNRLTYSLTNFFTSRLDTGPEKVEYLDLARVEVKQHFDLSQPEGGADDPSTTRKRPFSDVFMQLDLTPRRYLTLTYKGELSLYDEEFKRHNLAAELRDSRGDRLSVDYQRQVDRGGKTVVDEIDARIGLKIWDGVLANFRFNRSFSDDQKIKNEYNVIIQRQCWGVSASFVDDPNDQRITVGINLYGVGELGAQTFSLGD